MSFGEYADMSYNSDLAAAGLVLLGRVRTGAILVQDPWNTYLLPDEVVEAAISLRDRRNILSWFDIQSKIDAIFRALGCEFVGIQSEEQGWLGRWMLPDRNIAAEIYIGGQSFLRGWLTEMPVPDHFCGTRIPVEIFGSRLQVGPILEVGRLCERCVQFRANEHCGIKNIDRFRSLSVGLFNERLESPAAADAAALGSILSAIFAEYIGEGMSLVPGRCLSWNLSSSKLEEDSIVLPRCDRCTWFSAQKSTHDLGQLASDRYGPISQPQPFPVSTNGIYAYHSRTTGESAKSFWRSASGAATQDSVAKQKCIAEGLERVCLREFFAGRSTPTFYTIQTWNPGEMPGLLRVTDPMVIARAQAMIEERTVQGVIRPIKSNGAAFGWTLEQASLHSIFEAIERDSLMRIWWRREGSRLNGVTNLLDSKWKSVLEELRESSVTVEVAHMFRAGVHSSVALMLRNLDPTAGQSMGIGAGAAWTIEEALTHALTEAVISLESQQNLLTLRERQKTDHRAFENHWAGMEPIEVQSCVEHFRSIVESDGAPVAKELIQDLDSEGFLLPRDLIIADVTAKWLQAIGCHVTIVLSHDLVPVTVSEGSPKQFASNSLRSFFSQVTVGLPSLPLT
ncbi:MAG: hypothetical protein HIU84_07350 [Acidobacteria bacterium]|nr:hypothetical protein [Acidobacteriota bacterium]